jgi:hypothetical protein
VHAATTSSAHDITGRCMHHGHLIACTACNGTWCHRPLHADTAWALKFQVCLGHTFTPATLKMSERSQPGWPDWAKFRHLGYFLKAQEIFLGKNIICCKYFKSLEGVWWRRFELSNWALLWIWLKIKLGEISCQFLPPGGRMVPRYVSQLLFSKK